MHPLHELGRHAEMPLPTDLQAFEELIVQPLHKRHEAAPDVHIALGGVRLLGPLDESRVERLVQDDVLVLLQEPQDLQSRTL